MIKNEYNQLKEFFYQYVGINSMVNGIAFSRYSDSVDYGSHIYKFISLLGNNEYISVDSNIVKDFSICLELEYKTPLLSTIIDNIYNGSYSDSYFDVEIYNLFEEFFRYLSINNTFNEAIHILGLTVFTHVGTLRNHLNDFIIFKNMIYNPNIEQKTLFKVQYIKRVRSDNKSYVMDFVKIDRKSKRITNDRNKVQSNTLDF